MPMTLLIKHLSVMIDTAINNGVIMELFPLAETPSSIDVDEDSIEEPSYEPDLLLLATLWPL